MVLLPLVRFVRQCKLSFNAQKDGWNERKVWMEDSVHFCIEYKWALAQQLFECIWNVGNSVVVFLFTWWVSTELLYCYWHGCWHYNYEIPHLLHPRLVEWNLLHSQWGVFSDHNHCKLKGEGEEERIFSTCGKELIISHHHHLCSFISPNLPLVD